MSDAETVPPAEVRRQVVVLAELAREEGGVIRERLFFDCDIYGPAMVAPMGRLHLTRCALDAGGHGAAALFVTVPERWLIGAVGLEGVVMEQCRLKNIGFIGTHDALLGLKAEFGVE